MVPSVSGGARAGVHVQLLVFHLGCIGWKVLIDVGGTSDFLSRGNKVTIQAVADVALAIAIAIRLIGVVRIGTVVVDIDGSVVVSIPILATVKTGLVGLIARALGTILVTTGVVRVAICVTVGFGHAVGKKQQEGCRYEEVSQAIAHYSFS
jgi:hypothetical protein